nr:hypothetical protein CTI12_AA204890 [Tanacetum cinerariifolium]
MVNLNSFLEAKWRERTKHRGHNQQWYQSKNHGRLPRKTSQFEFLQRQIIREKDDRLGRCVRQITKDCKNMLKKKIKEIEVYNSSISKDKYKQYNCFYCNQKGHVVKACPTKIKDEASYPQGQSVGFKEGSRDVNNITHAKINKNKDMVMCFKCQKHGHFTNRCPTKEHVASTNKAGQPKVSIKYLEFIQFKTRGIIKGTDNGTWDDFWNLDVDKIRQRHNDYLDDYFESLGNERTDKEGEEPRIVENTDTSEVHTFQEYVAFLNLIKDNDETSKEWDTYRNRFDKVLKWFYNHYLKRPLHGTIPHIIQGVPIHFFDLYKLMDCMGGYLRGASFAMEKGKERLEHFGIKLEEEKDFKQQQPAYQEKEETHIKCYKCQDLGHHDFEYPNKNEKDQDRFTSYKGASTSKPTNNEDTQKEIRVYLMQRLYSMHNLAANLGDSITPSIRKEIERLKHSQIYWTVYPCGNNVFEVRKGDESYGVNIDNRTCPCKWWDLSGVSCVHSVAAFSFLKNDPILGVSIWYSKKMWQNAYSYFIKPVGGSSMWPQTPEELPLPPVLRKMPSRPRKLIIKHVTERVDVITISGIMMTCHNCWEKGHNQKGCNKEKQPKPTIEKRAPGRKKAGSNIVFQTCDKDGGDADPSSAGPSVAGPSSAGPSVAGPSFAGPSIADLSSAGPSVADSTGSGTQTITEDPIVPTQQSKTSDTAKIIEDAIATGRLKTAGLKRRCKSKRILAKMVQDK